LYDSDVAIPFFSIFSGAECGFGVDELLLSDLEYNGSVAFAQLNTFCLQFEGGISFSMRPSKLLNILRISPSALSISRRLLMLLNFLFAMAGLQ
jgi:hypothetical protein